MGQGSVELKVRYGLAGFRDEMSGVRLGDRPGRGRIRGRRRVESFGFWVSGSQTIGFGVQASGIKVYRGTSIIRNSPTA